MYQFSLFLTAVSLYILGEVKRMNLFQALTDAMDIILESDESAGMFVYFICKLSIYHNPPPN